jgi:hypothetical protein
MAQDSYQLLNSYKYNFGSANSQPVVEQNQTYMAFFDGVGGTGPELIDQTAYFIRYIIDTQGNVVNPEPANKTSDPQATALYNLINNFEPGKNAVIRLIGNDPLSTTNPNDNFLTGIHPITHVGRIVPILVTETGKNIQDYVTTMSFSYPFTTSPPDIFLTPNVTAEFQASFGNLNTTEGGYVDLPYATTLTQYTNTNVWTNSSPEYIINSGSTQTSTRIKIRAKIYVSSSVVGAFQPTQDGQEFVNTYYGGAFNLRILQNNNVILEGQPIIYNKGQVLSPSTYNYINAGSGDGDYELTTGWIDYSANDEFKIQYKVDNDNSGYPLQIVGAGSGKYESRVRFIQEYQPGVSGSTSTSASLINGINAVYVSGGYFITGSTTNLYNADNGGISVLFCNEALSNIYQLNNTQNLDLSSSLMNFSPITIPFGDIQAGDWIRFEYNKDQVYNITKVFFNETTGYLMLIVTPSLSTITGFGTQTMNLNHFVIYRVINDGTYVVLDVFKPITGNSFTGIIQPEFVSKELIDNYDKIITDLTSKEIIN